jgi:hypothetical protein
MDLVLPLLLYNSARKPRWPRRAAHIAGSVIAVVAGVSSHRLACMAPDRLLCHGREVAFDGTDRSGTAADEAPRSGLTHQNLLRQAHRCRLKETSTPRSHSMRRCVR